MHNVPKMFTQVYFSCGAAPQRVSRTPHTQRRTTVGRTPLEEWSARRRDLYLTTHDTHNRRTTMATVGFEPTISAGERSQICALDRAVIGIGVYRYSILSKLKTFECAEPSYASAPALTDLTNIVLLFKMTIMSLEAHLTIATKGLTRDHQIWYWDVSTKPFSFLAEYLRLFVCWRLRW
jgi:hypothetical protein